MYTIVEIKTNKEVPKESYCYKMCGKTLGKVVEEFEQRIGREFEGIVYVFETKDLVYIVDPQFLQEINDRRSGVIDE